MIDITYIGTNNNNRFDILDDNDNYFINRLNWSEYDLSTLNNNIDLIILEEPIEEKYLGKCKEIKNTKSFDNVSVVALMSKFIESDCVADLIISDNVSDIEFSYHIKTVIKTRIIQKQLDKEKELYNTISNEQEKYRNMIENMKSGVAVLQTFDNGKTFTFIEFNKRAQILFKKRDTIGKELLDALPQLKDTTINDTIQNVWDNGKPEKIDRFKFCNDKDDLWGSAFIYKLLTTGEIVCIIDDITDRKNTQDRLKFEKENAVEINKLKSAILINMAHEIRVPIQSIMGFTDLIMKNNLTKEKILNYLDIIKNSSNSLLSIVNEITDLSKIENNKIKIYKKTFNLNLLMNNLKIECEQIFKDHTDIKFKFDIPKLDYKLYSDHERIKQVLNNLINNALKFTYKGTITCGYKLRRNNIEFFVKDSGIGIDKRNMDIVFERFVQLNDKKVTNHGIGLGLTISKSIVELLGGKIWVSSKRNVGSTFYFSVPLEKGVEEDIKISRISLNNLNKNYDWKNKKVLIVEDNYNNYLLTEIVLSQTDIVIDHAKDLNDFVNILQKNKYDIILMDFQLPDGDGFNLLEYMDKNNIITPVIIISAFASKDDELELYKLGVDYYISKPVKWDYLYSSMDKILSK